MRRYLLTSKPSGEFVGNANQTLWGVGIAEGSRTIVDSVAGWAWLPERMTPFVKAWNADPTMIAQLRNLRFWTWHRGWVKLTLRPRQQLSHHRIYDNGEGSSHDWSRFTHDGEKLLLEYGSSGSDCDGRHSSHGESFVEIAHVSAPPEPTALDWQHGKSGQRDYTAEAAGY